MYLYSAYKSIESLGTLMIAILRTAAERAEVTKKECQRFTSFSYDKLGKIRCLLLRANHLCIVHV